MLIGDPCEVDAPQRSSCEVEPARLAELDRGEPCITCMSIEDAVIGSDARPKALVALVQILESSDQRLGMKLSAEVELAPDHPAWRQLIEQPYVLLV
jgi:hypothetical protein